MKRKPKYPTKQFIATDRQTQEALAAKYKLRKLHYLKSYDELTAIKLARKDCGLE